jgi:Ca2+-binding EF-hand superfamily protein
MSVSSIDSQSTSLYWETLFGAKSQQKTEDDLAALLFQDLDADQSGGIGLDESGLEQSQFDALDTDKDGAVSLAELQAGLETQRQALFTQMQLEVGQTDSTASASAQSDSGSATGSGQSQSVYDSMDTNQDGVVSLEELNAALENQKASRSSGKTSGQVGGGNDAFGLLNTSGKVDAQSILASIAASIAKYQGTSQSLGFALTA